MAAVEPVVAGEGLAAPTTDGGRDAPGAGRRRGGDPPLRAVAAGPAAPDRRTPRSRSCSSALTIWVEDSVLGFEQDVLRLFDFLSPTVERVLHGSLEWIGYAVGLDRVPRCR